MIDRETVAVYDAGAERYRRERSAGDIDAATIFGASISGWRADLGCGPGFHAGHLGDPLVALDASMAMLQRVAASHRVQADLAALPFRPGRLAGGWASKSYQHLAHEELPVALADLHHALAPDAPVDVSVFAGTGTTTSTDEFPGRHFSLWEPKRLRDLFVGAGFEIDAVEVGGDDEWPLVRVRARRARSLPDRVGPAMRLLVCGLNPSLYAADRGVNFARPGNRFWPALLDAGLASVDRDPAHALRHHGIGMTDLVKRATAAASELSADEYAEGLARVERLCAWLRPGAVCMVGLAGWRAAVDRKAGAGWQERDLGGSPVYVMPSTSGLNASTQHTGFVEHLRAAASVHRHTPSS